MFVVVLDRGHSWLCLLSSTMGSVTSTEWALIDVAAVRWKCHPLSAEGGLGADGATWPAALDREAGGC